MKRKTKVIAIIPARGGSKSIKYKNLALLNGKPLIYYSIKSAIKSKLVDKIIVSTDNKRIKSVALKYGAEVPFLRPKNLSGDKVLDYPVIDHVIKKLELNTLKHKDIIINYPPPAIKGKDISIKYITQITSSPPLFGIFSNHPDLITKSYEKYLSNQIRQRIDFNGVPIRLSFRKK